MENNFTKEYFMKKVLELAEKALSLGELPIASIIVLDNKIISEAYTSEVKEKRFLVHAELLALDKADKIYPFPGKRKDVKLFTNLEPCPMCLGACMSFFIGEVYYALESPSDGAVNLIKNWKKDDDKFLAYKIPYIEGGILEYESSNLFKKYTEIHKEGSMHNFAKSLIKTSYI
ncbi:MAG: nucleoside deaminase [Candidatus Sericytochromatia bacterium]